MKAYQTEIEIDAPIDKVWRVLTDFSAYPAWNPLIGRLKGELTTGGRIELFVIPLARSFHATLKQFQEHREMTWVGVQVAAWFLSGEHYYRLSPLGNGSTQLLHGESFRGLGSRFIKEQVLREMEDAFIQHNLLLKERAEDG